MPPRVALPKAPSYGNPDHPAGAAMVTSMGDDLKSRIYHWNVTGPMFQTLHLMFETQYNELALAVDAIAERIRSLGAPTPPSRSAHSTPPDPREDRLDATQPGRMTPRQAR